MGINIATWPAHLGDKPRVLPHDGEQFSEDDVEYLVGLNWEPVDFRTLPSTSMEERQDAILAWLEGVRLGTITPQVHVAKILELEMRACSLHAGKVMDDKPAEISDETLGTILDWNK